MKSLCSVLAIGAAGTFLISSCTMEKRLYMTGYDIDWKTRSHITGNPGCAQVTANNQRRLSADMDTIQRTLQVADPAIDCGSLIASSDNVAHFFSPEKKYDVKMLAGNAAASNFAERPASKITHRFSRHRKDGIGFDVFNPSYFFLGILSFLVSCLAIYLVISLALDN